MQNAGAGDDQRRLDQFMVSDETDNPSAKKLLGGTYARRFDASMANTGLPAARPEKKGGGGNPFGKALGAVKDFGGEALETGMSVLDAPRKYVGAPAFGILSGLNKSETYTDPKTGRQYKKSASLKDVGESLAEAVQHPIRAYEKGGESSDLYLNDPEKNFAFRAVARTVQDPLSYVGAGLASRVVKGAGATGKVARVATEILDSGGPGVALGANIAGEGEQEYGSKVPGWNKLSPQARTLIAGVLGGAVGGKVASETLGKGKIGLSIKEVSDHEALGLDPAKSYTPEEIKAAYRKRIREVHPDVNDSATATEEAAQLNAAFERSRNGLGARAGTAPNGDNMRQSTTTEPPPAENVSQTGPGTTTTEPPPTARPFEPGPASTPPGGQPPYEAFGASAPKPKADLFNTVPRESEIGREAEFQTSFRGRLDSILRRSTGGLGKRLDPNVVKDTEVTPFLVRERTRLGNMINSYEGLADDLWGRVEDSGLKVELGGDGQFRLVDLPGQPTFGDTVELATPEGRAAYAQLTRKQLDAAQDLIDFNHELNANIRFHGGEVGLDRTIEGSYFPRMVKGAGGTAKPRPTVGGGSRLGGEMGFEKARTMEESMAQGIEDGVDYAHPREAYRQMVRAKLKAAEGDYLTDRIKPLGKTSSEIQSGDLGRLGFDWVAIDPSVAPGLAGRFFPPDVAQRIVAALNDRGHGGTVGETAKWVNSKLTPIRAVMDISWLGQQGAPMLFRHPVKAAKGAATVIRSAMGERFGGGAAYRDLIDAEAARGPGLKTLIQSGLHWVPGDIGEVGVGFERGGVPVWRNIKEFSNETFAHYLNYMRLTFANDAYERFAKMGISDSEAARRELMGAMNSVNRMSGFTGRKPTSIESIVEFAPRFFSSAVEQTVAAVSRGGLEGSIARAHMGRMLAGGALMVVAANAARGYDTDLDPTSPNFLRFRNVGGLDVSPFGTYDSLFRNFAALALDGDKAATLDRAAWSKLSPSAKIANEVFRKHSTYLGEPLNIDSPGGIANTVWEQAKSSAPFGVQNLIEDGPMAAAVGSLGVTNTPMTPVERRNFRRDEVARAQFGRAYNDLSGSEKSQVNEDPEVKRRQAEADRNTLTRAGEGSSYQAIKDQIAGQIQTLGDELNAGTIDGDTFREQYRRTQDILAGARQMLTKGYKGDKEVDGWFALYDQAKMADGRTDYDKLDQLQADYAAAHPGAEEKVLKLVGANDTPVLREYREARALAKEYYAIPAYRGMSAADAQKANDVLSAANDMVSLGQARNRDHAFALLMRQDPQAVILARRAVRAGPNPARKRWRTDPRHKVFAKFYSATAIGG